MTVPHVPAGADSGTRDDDGRREGGEGRPPKAPLVWGCIALIVVGFTLGGLAIVIGSLVTFLVGLVVTAIGGFGSLAAGVMRYTE